MQNKWSSLYLFIGQADHADELASFASEVMGSYSGQANDWFFIRYAEGGVHVRLRVGPSSLAHFPEVKERMADRCRELALGSEISGWVRQFGAPDLSGKVREPGESVEVAYEPETVRYGGPEAIACNEELFRISTAIAVRVIAATRERDDARAQIAADFMMAAVATMADFVDARVYFREYSTNWRAAWPWTPQSAIRPVHDKGALEGHYNGHVEALRSRKPPKSVPQLWGGKLSEAREQFHCLYQRGKLISPVSGQLVATDTAFEIAFRSMVSSQIHMLNNRLGLWPDSEVVIAEQLSRRI
jgi:thiopeptide-type bacteriocin biosynthesis protein